MANYKISELEILYESQPRIQLNQIGPELNVIFGPNESGKSRVKEFIEWMIFVQSPLFQNLTPQAKKKEFLSITDILKGSLKINNGFETLTITQQLSDNTPITSLSGTNLRLDDLIHILSDDLSLDHYRNVFSLNLDALSDSKSKNLLSEDKTAEVFLSASQTGSGISLSALVADLKSKKEAIFSDAPNARNRQINMLLTEIDAVDKEIRQIRREQQASMSYTSDIKSLQDEHKTLKAKLNAINEELTNLLLTKNYAQTFQDYITLSNHEPVAINNELIGEIVNIRELLNQCKQHEGDEKVLNQLLLEKSELQDSLNEIEANLKKTLDPTIVTDELNSHSFITSLELEKQANTQFIQDRSRTQDAFDKENAELVRLTSRVNDLSQQIENINREKPQDRTNQIPAKQNLPKRNMKKPLISFLAIAAGVAACTISILADQLIGVASGVLLIAIGLANQLIKSHMADDKLPASPTSIESIEESHISRELDGLYSQIKHQETQIEKYVQTLEDLEKQRISSKQVFASKIRSLGFEESLDPIHIELYINDFEKYKTQHRHLRDIESRVDALSNWFENFFNSISILQGKSSNIYYEHKDQITTISHARAWLENLLELALEYEVLKKQVLETESETRTLEKSLISQFSSIDNAKLHFNEFDPIGITERIETSTSNRQSLEEKLSHLDQEIGSIRKSAEHAGQETQMQDRLLHKESLIQELQEAHQHFEISFIAHKYAEVAFTKCQRESQPEVLLKASSFLSKTTNGRWNSISIDIVDSSRSKNKEVQMTVSNEYESLDILKLSQGAQEQLYLCLRLALMESSPRGKDVPALFDDIAVNADKNRFASIAPLVSQIANSRQVFYFTCHEWVRDELAKFENTKVLNIS